MSGLFVCLSIPVLIFILLYNYWHNSAAIAATLNDDVAKTNQASIETHRKPDPAGRRPRSSLLAAVAAQDPVFQNGAEPGVSLSSADVGAADRCRLCELRGRLPSRRDPDRR